MLIKKQKKIYWNKPKVKYLRRSCATMYISEYSYTNF